jgi:copper chaperone CopZ
MKFIKIIIISLALLPILQGCSAKINNIKTETFKVYGNCGMCKKTIEKAVAVKGEAKGEWDKDTKVISLTYDSIITNTDAILKRIADVGYDNEKFLATSNTYDNLHSCCKYERSPEITKLANTQQPTTETALVESNMNNSHANHETQTDTTKTGKVDVVKSNSIQVIYTNYLLLKDALVKTNANTAKKYASDLLKSVESADMSTMETKVHSEFMKVMNNLVKQTRLIANSTNIEKQRSTFSLVSKDMYAILKVSNPDKPVYYQHCPMYNDGKGANWLSAEKEIKNPYYGSQMLNCGSVQETIK